MVLVVNRPDKGNGPDLIPTGNIINDWVTKDI